MDFTEALVKSKRAHNTGLSALIPLRPAFFQKIRWLTSDLCCTFLSFREIHDTENCGGVIAAFFYIEFGPVSTDIGGRTI